MEKKRRGEKTGVVAGQGQAGAYPCQNNKAQTGVWAYGMKMAF